MKGLLILLLLGGAAYYFFRGNFQRHISPLEIAAGDPSTNAARDAFATAVCDRPAEVSGWMSKIKKNPAAIQEQRRLPELHWQLNPAAVQLYDYYATYLNKSGVGKGVLLSLLKANIKVLTGFAEDVFQNAQRTCGGPAFPQGNFVQDSVLITIIAFSSPPPGRVVPGTP